VFFWKEEEEEPKMLEKRIRFAALIAAVLYGASFPLPANVVYFGEHLEFSTASSGVVSAVMFTDAIKDVPSLLLTAPTNLLIIAAFALFWRRRYDSLPYLGGYALLGQLFWLTKSQYISFTIGYWIWLASGVVLFAVSVAARWKLADLPQVQEVPSQSRQFLAAFLRMAARHIPAIAAWSLVIVLAAGAGASFHFVNFEKFDSRLSRRAPAPPSASGLAFVGNFESVTLRDAGGTLSDRSTLGLRTDMTRPAFGVHVSLPPQAVADLLAGTAGFGSSRSAILGKYEGQRVALVSLPKGKYKVVAYATSDGEKTRRVSIKDEPVLDVGENEVVLAGKLAEERDGIGRLSRNPTDKKLIRDVFKYEVEDRKSYLGEDVRLAKDWLPVLNAAAGSPDGS
jgi:hypothetical protein